MKTHRALLIALALAAPGLTAFAQATATSPAKRQAALELAAKLLAPRPDPAASLPAGLVNPFDPAASRKVGVIASGALSDREILERIAARIAPSGAMMFGDHWILLLGEKKLKVGETLTINFEGADYVVVITEINRTSFKIRLNREEVTRPIKSGKAP
jgi:hypothetical protein